MAVSSTFLILARRTKKAMGAGMRYILVHLFGGLCQEAAEKWRWRLFTKNTGLCEVVRRRIGTDSCPVPEG